MPLKYKSSNLTEKIKTIDEVMQGVKSKSLIARDFGIAKSTLLTFLKNEDKLRSDLSTEGNTKTAKIVKRPKFGNLNQCLVQWFKQMRDKNIPISGPLIQAQAEKLANLLNLPDFKAP